MHVSLILALLGCGRALVAFGEAPAGDDSGTALDVDDDGVTVAYDCDDHDAAVGAAEPESWNGLDDDCDGLVDDLAIGQVAFAAIGGPTADTHLGDDGTIALGGDLTGDGIPDLVLGSVATGTGSVWLLDGGSVLGSAEDLSRIYTFRAWGFSSSEPLGYVSGPMRDITGDGVDDLLVVASNLQNERSAGYGYLFEGGNLEGSGPVDEDLHALFSGGEGDRLHHAVAEDIDGDGLADVVVGAPHDDHRGYGKFRGTAEDTGNVSVFPAYWISHEWFWYQLEYASDQIHGSDAGDRLGSGLTLEDLDEDGYADVIASAPDAHLREEDQAGTGLVYVFPGNYNASWSGDRAVDAARVTLFADADVEHLGEGGLARPGDLDGDGALDLALAEPGRSVHVWYGMGGLVGAVAWSDANWILPVADACGTSLTTDADLDADGRDELVLGCPTASVPGNEAGAVRVFSGELPLVEFTGEAPNDHLGAAMSSGADLHQGGGEELVVGAPGNDRDGTEAGMVYVIGRAEAD